MNNEPKIILELTIPQALDLFYINCKANGIPKTLMPFIMLSLIRGRSPSESKPFKTLVASLNKDALWQISLIESINRACKDLTSEELKEILK
jgi:hypothetical protein